ncbi:hypothetical protein Bca52824_026397 [Brassica carinata]|uniref:Uncharacterized protein n=1 Tax=Brassica carinata TaxID=52824 RepID=A0A8X7SGK6_BRACI|nr:hypothetical protein Bca52824_026397 [Brassica carinata]
MMDSSPAPEIKQATRTEGRNASAKTTCRKRARDSSYSSTRKTRKEIENNTAMATNDSTRHWDVSKPRIESRRRARGRRPHEPLLSSQHAAVENRAAVPLNVQKLKPGDYGSTNQSKHEQSNKEAVDKLQALKLILEPGRESKGERALVNPKNRAPLTATDSPPCYDSKTNRVQPSVEPPRERRTSRTNLWKQSREQNEEKQRPEAKEKTSRGRSRSPPLAQVYTDAGAHQIYKRRTRES